jgi:hypothetical protein
MTFSYPDSSVWMDDLVNGLDRHGYAMCADHADRMIPPLGWTAICWMRSRISTSTTCVVFSS